MRVYLPATSTVLARLAADRQLPADADTPCTAFAVTPGLREWYVDDDLEALEYAAMLEAARASLRLLDADASAALRRVVIALDAGDADVEIRDDLDRGVVRVRAPIALGEVASLHLDDIEASETVAAAAAAITAADLGDAAAQDTVDDAEGYELGWYATQELPAVLAELSA